MVQHQRLDQGRHRTPHRRITAAVRKVAPLGIATATAVAGLSIAPTSASAWGVWDSVAACESTGNWSINTGNGYYGGLQFAHSTWVGYGGQTYASYAHQATKSQQIAIARRVLHGQGPGAWPTCSVRAGLTRANGGADPNATAGGGGGSTPAPAPAPAPAPTPTPSPGTSVTRYVSADTAAHVRSGPGSGYRVVGSLSRGTEVSGTLSNGWVRIGDGRYVGSGVLSSSPVGQRAADGASRNNQRGSVARLAVDGVRGPLTTKALQAYVGTTQDGILGPITTKALQRTVGTTPDGIWGPKSQAALQDYLGISRDGSRSLNARTIIALQNYLNSKVAG